MNAESSVALIVTKPACCHNEFMMSELLPLAASEANGYNHNTPDPSSFRVINSDRQGVQGAYFTKRRRRGWMLHSSKCLLDVRAREGHVPFSS